MTNEVPDITTERLRLTSWTDEDADRLSALYNDPIVMEHQPADMRAARYRFTVGQLHESWRTNGYGRWALHTKDADEFVGFVGLSFPGHWPDPEVSWMIEQPQWGKGYATEAAMAALHFGFDKLGFDRIMAITTPGNTASARVMEKLGMSRTDDEVCALRKIPVVACVATPEMISGR